MHVWSGYIRSPGVITLLITFNTTIIHRHLSDSPPVPELCRLSGRSSRGIALDVVEDGKNQHAG